MLVEFASHRSPYAECLQYVEAQVRMKIRDFRKEKGMTQDEFALRAGLIRTHLYRLHSGGSASR